MRSLTFFFTLQYLGHKVNWFQGRTDGRMSRRKKKIEEDGMVGGIGMSMYVCMCIEYENGMRKVEIWQGSWWFEVKRKAG